MMQKTVKFPDGSVRNGTRKDDKNDFLRKIMWTGLCGAVALITSLAVTWAQKTDAKVENHGEQISAMQVAVQAIDKRTERIEDFQIRQDEKLDRILEKL